MLQSQTILSKIEFETNTGTVFLKLDKRIMSGDQVISSEPHRFALGGDTDVSATIAQVNNHMQQLGYPSISEADRGKIEAFNNLARQSVA